MIIRKLFKFEGAHIVRNCTSKRCRENIHGHSYQVEVFITSDRLDKGYMIMDFCRLEQVKEFIESFDHSYSLWNEEPDEFKNSSIPIIRELLISRFPLLQKDMPYCFTTSSTRFYNIQKK